MPRLYTKVELKGEGRIGGLEVLANVRVTSKSELELAYYNR